MTNETIVVVVSVLTALASLTCWAGVAYWLARSERKPRTGKRQQGRQQKKPENQVDTVRVGDVVLTIYRHMNNSAIVQYGATFHKAVSGSLWRTLRIPELLRIPTALVKLSARIEQEVDLSASDRTSLLFLREEMTAAENRIRERIRQHQQNANGGSPETIDVSVDL